MKCAWLENPTRSAICPIGSRPQRRRQRATCSCLSKLVLLGRDADALGEHAMEVERRDPGLLGELVETRPVVVVVVQVPERARDPRVVDQPQRGELAFLDRADLDERLGRRAAESRGARADRGPQRVVVEGDRGVVEAAGRERLPALGRDLHEVSHEVPRFDARAEHPQRAVRVGVDHPLVFPYEHVGKTGFLGTIEPGLPQADGRDQDLPLLGGKGRPASQERRAPAQPPVD